MKKKLLFYSLLLLAGQFPVPVVAAVRGVDAVSAHVSADENALPRQSAEAVARLQKKLAALPVMKGLISDRTGFDWLLTPEKSGAGIYRTPDGKGIVVANAMVSRTFRLFPNLATVDFTNRMLGESLLRAVSAEGCLWIDGKAWKLGGLSGQLERGYLRNDWLDAMQPLPESFVVEDFSVKEVEPSLRWARTRWALNDRDATGRELVFVLRGRGATENVRVHLHFAVYDQVPVIRKWMEVENGSGRRLTLDKFQLEYLAMAEPESPSDGNPDDFLLPNLHVESDYACSGTFTERETDITEK